MNLDIKTVAVFLPVLAAILFGLNYAIYGRLLQIVNVQTLIVISALFYASAALVIYFLFPAKINFSPFMNLSYGGLLIVCLFASLTAWVCTLLVIGKVSATYAAIGEISYPFFTALFTYLIFRSRELDTSMAVGGLLILVGSAVVISDKFKIGG